MPLFQSGKFTSAAGLVLDWKIECDALTDQDWDTIALASLPYLPKHRYVVGVPRGGLKLAESIKKFRRCCSIDDWDKMFHPDRVLIVDDVFTTGTSLKKFGERYHDFCGFVAFARVPLPDWCKCFMQVQLNVP